MKHVRPDALGRPALKTVVERLARAIDRRRVLPSATGDENVDDAADHPAVIDARLAARVGWKMRLMSGLRPARTRVLGLFFLVRRRRLGRGA